MLDSISSSTSNLVRRQQQTRLGIRNPLDEPDSLQRLIEGLKAFHAEFDNNVPTAIGGVAAHELQGCPATI